MSLTPPPLDSLLKGKYARLSEYFRGFELQDLKQLSVDELAEMVESKDKVAALLFAKEFLMEKPSPPPTGSFNASFSPIVSTPSVTFQDGRLSFRKALVSETYRDLQPNKIAPSFLQAALRAHRISAADVEVVDFSANFLFDTDLEAVANFVLTLPHCRDVDLSHNKFCGQKADASLIELLRQPRIKYVDICLNALATTERIDFFAALSNEHLRKLIWIQREWIPPGNWKIIIPEKGRQTIVEEAHRAYYRVVSAPVYHSNNNTVSYLGVVYQTEKITDGSLAANVAFCEASNGDKIYFDLIRNTWRVETGQGETYTPATLGRLSNRVVF